MQNMSNPRAETDDRIAQLRELQTSILLSYFGVYAQVGEVRRRAMDTFAHTTRVSTKEPEIALSLELTRLFSSTAGTGSHTGAPQANADRL